MDFFDIFSDVNEISKYKFQKLTLDQKGEYVFHEGEYIGVREYYNFRINLYSLYDFFVEVWYFPPENKIKKIEVLEDEKMLDVYIDTMNALFRSSNQKE